MTVPMTPADCDLRDFAFMPLDVVRLRDSDLAIQVSGEEFRCAVMLWCASWHQVPAASLPDDDATLSALAGYGRAVSEWKKLRIGALRGWVACDDGRLYHPVVAEKARDAWQAKLEQRWRTECARIKKHNQRHGTTHDVPELMPWIDAGCPQGQMLSVSGTPQRKGGDSTAKSPRTDGTCPDHVLGETHSKGQGEGQGQLKDKDIGEGGDKLPRYVHASGDAANDPFQPRVNAIVKMLRPLGCALHGSNPHVRKWAEKGIEDVQILTAYSLAKKRRQAAEDPQPVNPGYVDSILTDVIAETARPPAKRSQSATARLDEWNRQLSATIAAATNEQPAEIDMGYIDATGQSN